MPSDPVKTGLEGPMGITVQTFMNGREMITENNNSINISTESCKRCGVKLRDVQVNCMIGNHEYNEWAREGFCSLDCFETFSVNRHTVTNKNIYYNKNEESYSYSNYETDKLPSKDNKINIRNDTNNYEMSNAKFTIIVIRNFALSFIALSAVHYFTVGNIKPFQALVGSIVASIFSYHANRRKE